jgi:hypothetical protein
LQRSRDPGTSAGGPLAHARFLRSRVQLLVAGTGRFLFSDGTARPERHMSSSRRGLLARQSRQLTRLVSGHEFLARRCFGFTRIGTTAAVMYVESPDDGIFSTARFQIYFHTTYHRFESTNTCLFDAVPAAPSGAWLPTYQQLPLQISVHSSGARRAKGWGCAGHVFATLTQKRKYVIFRCLHKCNYNTKS